MKHTPPKEAAFMGTVTAGLAHELKNILAIIKESAGLMEDLLAMSQDVPFPHQDRFVRSLTRISDQVARGVDLAIRLSRFAHAPDESVAGVDLKELADQAAYLSHRFARGMGVTLKAVAREQPIIMVTDPLRAQMMLFQCIDLLIHLEGRGTHIDIRPAEGNDGNISLQLVYEGAATDKEASADPVSSPLWPALQETVQSLKATIEPCSPSIGVTIHFSRDFG